MRSPPVLGLELVLLFGLVPVGLWRTWLPLGPTVLVAFLLIATALSLAPDFSWHALFRDALHRATRSEVRLVLIRFAAAAAALSIGTAVFAPDLLGRLVRERPGLFVLICVFYPLVSVLPQELVFRVWFFRRYGPVLGPPRLAAAVNAVAFGWAHVFFDNALAVILSTAGGFLFARTWQRTGSIGLVWIEHAIYGILIFGVGLGWYFYHGNV